MTNPSFPHTCIMVLGMHRSGTSVTTRIIHLCGASLGRTLMAPHPDDNPSGYWENDHLHRIHEASLQTLGRAWHDPRGLPQDWRDSPELDRLAAALKEGVKAEFHSGGLICVKDPRVCLLWPAWDRALRGMGCQTKSVLVVRHPGAIVQSMGRRGFDPTRTLLLYIDHLVQGWEASKVWPGFRFSFEQLLESPETLGRGLLGLGLPWPNSVLNPNVINKGQVRSEPKAPEAVESQLWGAALELYQAMAGQGDCASSVTAAKAVHADFRTRLDSVSFLVESEAARLRDLSFSRTVIERRKREMQETERQLAYTTRALREAKRELSRIRSSPFYKVAKAVNPKRLVR